MANLTLKKEEDIFVTIEYLKLEEARLTEQKEHLTTLLNQLETKAKEVVSKRKQKVDSLNSEVLGLQEKCNQLTYCISEGSTLEFSQATRQEDKDGDKVIAAIPEGVPTTPTENHSRHRF